MLELVGSPEDRFCHDTAQFKGTIIPYDTSRVKLVTTVKIMQKGGHSTSMLEQIAVIILNVEQSCLTVEECFQMMQTE